MGDDKLVLQSAEFSGEGFLNANSLTEIFNVSPQKNVEDHTVVSNAECSSLSLKFVKRREPINSHYPVIMPDGVVLSDESTTHRPEVAEVRCNDDALLKVGDRKRTPLPPLLNNTPVKKIKDNSCSLDESPSNDLCQVEIQQSVLHTTSRVSTPVENHLSNTTLDVNGALECGGISTNYNNIETSILEIIQDKLEEIFDVVPLEPLSLRDVAELESSLQLGDKYDYGPDAGWKSDWGGNLQLFEKEVIANRDSISSQPKIKPIKLPYYEWVHKNSSDNISLRGLELLFSYVFHMKGTPSMAKKILAHAVHKRADSLEQRLKFHIDAVKRITFDPLVLQQDGWITKKADSPQGSLGGSNLIGRRVVWQRYDAIIIAFTIDEKWGALWKAIWLSDLETFDLEADEVQEAMKNWDKKQTRLSKKKDFQPSVSVGSTRFSATAKLRVQGIEHGIILAISSNKGSRGVFWPARVMHIAETSLSNSGNVRRNSSKNQIQVVFLAPFWNDQNYYTSKAADITDPYSNGPLFEVETIDVSEDCLQPYPFESLSIEQIQSSFRFYGLPKSIFPRYLDSHRLAIALKTYARKHIPKTSISHDENVIASASLTESHALSVITPIFPPEVLSIPYEFILNKLPRQTDQAFSMLFDNFEDSFEPVINIQFIVDSMTPPQCLGKKRAAAETSNLFSPDNTNSSRILSPDQSITPVGAVKQAGNEDNDDNIDNTWSLKKIASDLLIRLFELSQERNHELACLVHLVNTFLTQLKQIPYSSDHKEAEQTVRNLRRFLCLCLLIKGCGEDHLISSNVETDFSKTIVVSEWRKMCERLYKRVVGKLSLNGYGNGITVVITDSRCNGHITADGAYERRVRLPAAIKGAKLAGAGTDPHILLVDAVEEKYLEMAENVVIPKAHQVSYTKRLKAKVSMIAADETGASLTDDSEGEGGNDTKGSRGSYIAAAVGVATAIKAADMVVGGMCVNVFCAIRPPGHHAGRELHPMNAISNGFCLLNAAACAAIYAATSQAEGGLGLRRVCIIDFDVHHGNGTQDILCATYDPRFLYVSLHAGGAHINGFDEYDSEDESFRLKPGGKTQDGIFPGRCGDFSPHEGVLNIPLGEKVTPANIGAALVSQVSPRVEEFSPDLIILSAGFDAHKNDPLGMGGLSAEDFGSVTEVSCQIAYKTCSGRIISILEGGYGVPCCRKRSNLFLPNDSDSLLLDLGDDLPHDMNDEIPLLLQKKFDKCHAEGFLHCVKEHVQSLVKCNKRK